MPVPESRVDALVAVVSGIYDEAELALLRAITARLLRGLDDSDWQQQKLAEIGQLRAAARTVVAALAGNGPQAVRAALAASWRAGNADALTGIAGAPPVPQKAPQAVQALADAVVSELRALHAQILPSAESAYRQTVAAGAARRLAGVQSTRRAAQAVWQGLTDRGITGFTDTTGRRWQLHSYVEMSVRTAVTRALAQGVIDAGAAVGNPFAYVTDRPQECAVCRPWEHRVLVLYGPVIAPAVASLEQARRAGLHHPNCRHDLGPFVPGRTRLAPGRADPEGDAARQTQRYLERQLRRWRAREAGALTEQAQREAAARIRFWDNELGQHIAATGLTRKVHREHPGAGYAAPASRAGDPAREL